MKVVNVYGYNFIFEKNGIIYSIPNDNLYYEIPDECIHDDFSRILQVVEYPKKPKLKNENEIKVENENENKNEIKVENKVEDNEKPFKPLKGKKLNNSVRAKARQKLSKRNK
jgi:hypothetical protein